MIRLEHVSRTFREKSMEVRALQDVSLHVRKGEIYGIVGFSGAGKSTLIRLVNRLETPDNGTVRVNGQELAGLKGKALTSLRRKIGMVFQQFNLLEGKTVFHNIAIPLRMEGRPKEEIERRVSEVLDFVESVCRGERNRNDIRFAVGTSKIMQAIYDSSAAHKEMTVE